MYATDPFDLPAGWNCDETCNHVSGDCGAYGPQTLPYWDEDAPGMSIDLSDVASWVPPPPA